MTLRRFAPALPVFFALIGATITMAHSARADGASVTGNGSRATIADNTGQGILFPFELLDLAFGANVDKDSGLVSYDRMQSDVHLKAFMEAVAKADRAKFPVFTSVVDDPDHPGKQMKIDDRTPELAFLIDAFNATVVKTIADNPEVNGPYEIKDFMSAKTHVVAGKTYSLEELRNEIAQRDPRALFALCDGTKGAPLLMPFAYRFSELNELLNLVASNYINDPNNVQTEEIKSIVTVSQYFAQFNEYFKLKSSRKPDDGLRRLLGVYYKARDRKYLLTGDYAFIFKPSNQSLNRQPGALAHS